MKRTLLVYCCIATIILISGCKKSPPAAPIGWDVCIRNTSDQDYSNVRLLYNGVSFETGSLPSATKMAAGLGNGKPDAVDVVLIMKDGTEHKVHVIIPPPFPGGNPRFPKYHLVIKSADEVVVSDKDPYDRPIDTGQH